TLNPGESRPRTAGAYPTGATPAMTSPRGPTLLIARPQGSGYHRRAFAPPFPAPEIPPMRCSLAGFLLLLASTTVSAADGNRLTYLDENNPYYVSRRFPRLVTPQWVGEPGVEAVVILAIDDMRGPDRWEAFLRPILRRLQQIDGRAPVSIMTCQIDPKHPHLQTWLK